MSAKGHWRRLKPGQVGEGRYGEDTPGKTWVDVKRTDKTRAAKKMGKVPAPVLVRVDKDFAVFAVPGGSILFAVHLSVAERFANLTKESKNWISDKKVRSMMMGAEKEGKFGIFRTKSPVIGY